MYICAIFLTQSKVGFYPNHGSVLKRKKNKAKKCLTMKQDQGFISAGILMYTEDSHDSDNVSALRFCRLKGFTP